jgi:hypothetical protein
MQPAHLYYDPTENPGSALYRLLQITPDKMQQTCAFDANEAQLAEAIARQAIRALQTLRAGVDALTPLLPAPLETGLAQHASLSDMLTLLHHQSNTIAAIGQLYQNMAAEFFSDHPDEQPHPALPHFERDQYQARVQEQARALLAHYDKHYYFPLGRLMQLLPGDITNLPRLTPEQGEMCSAVSHYAGQACHTLGTGLTAIEKMQRIIAQHAASAAAALPDIAPFVAYLRAEVDFMRGNCQDYRDAARSIARRV